ncbi:AraC family transcriptional regulator [Saonia flava]|uniref:AraC family transcriptional regulator n=1 Tax=Saonia flava TaxID=523696 RepID=A0A846QR04_9FLAO|nr:GyrI-like domain-containing protein [Saonia flava]NJB71456.1 AraC family transcriptional regulator [Saonia flava]
MEVFLRIENVPEKTVVGMSAKMTLTDNKTSFLWGKFMPRHKEIKGRLGSEFYAMQVYGSPLFKSFTPQTVFEQWACVPVQKIDDIPLGMESFIIPIGSYAVFVHKGLPSDFSKTMEYISKVWFPKSDYTWDFRPHFQVMGNKYKNNDPNSEEEVWVPVKLK